MRLDQFLSQSLNVSRQQAKQLLRKSAITVNQQPCIKAQQQVQESDEIRIDDVLMDWPGHIYWMMHKAPNTCCSHIDDGYPSALNSLPRSKKKLHFAGRLDADTTGLLLISSDGQWCHRISSPKQTQQKQKRYAVHLRDGLSTLDIQTLEQGLLLNGESKPTLPASVDHISDQYCHISIAEGRYHQVKRMFAALGNKVMELHREQIGSLTLDPELAQGQYRRLTAEEIALF